MLCIVYVFQCRAVQWSAHTPAPHAGRVVTKVKQGSSGQADAAPRLREEEKYKCNLCKQNFASEGFTWTPRLKYNNQEKDM